MSRRTSSVPPRHNGVRAARRALDLTQAQLAEHLGVSRQTVVAIEQGGYAPSVYLALDLAAALSLDVESLFNPGEAGPDHHRAGA